MKKLIYLFFGLLLVPAVSLMSDSSTMITQQQELGFVGSVGKIELDLDDQDIEEVVSEVLEEEGAEALVVESEIEGVVSESETIVLASNTEPEVATEEEVKAVEEPSAEEVEEGKTEEIINWKQSLTQEEKKLFRGILRRRKRKKTEQHESLSKLTLDKAKELLEKAKARKKKREQQKLKEKEQSAEQGTNQVATTEPRPPR